MAALKSEAVERDNDYVINGQKVWTSGAHKAKWALLLARTDFDAPEHKGISVFLVDMKTPGITVRPLLNLIGGHAFNEVFLDNVHVPKENLVLEKNQRWRVVTRGPKDDPARTNVGLVVVAPKLSPKVQEV